MPRGKALSLFSASAVIASLTLRRLRRSRLLWGALFFALLPLLPLVFDRNVHGSEAARVWREFVGLGLYMEFLVVSMLAAPAIAEEIDGKTYAYLWSRPLPRYSVFLGKLGASTLVGAVLLFLSFSIAYAMVGVDIGFLLSALAAAFAGLIAVGAGSATLGLFLPKYPLPISLFYYLVFDFGLGNMPFAGNKLSIFHNLRVLANVSKGELATSIPWLCGITGLWLGLAAWRIASREFSAPS